MFRKSAIGLLAATLPLGLATPAIASDALVRQV